MEATTILIAAPAAWLAFKALTGPAELFGTHQLAKPTRAQIRAEIKAQRAKAEQGGAYPSGKPIGRLIQVLPPGKNAKPRNGRIPGVYRRNAWLSARGRAERIISPVNAADLADYLEYARRIEGEQ